MKSLVVFYSYTGHTKTLAHEFANKATADIAEILDIKHFGTIKAYTAGSFAAMRGKAWPVQPLSADPSGYDHLVLFSPVWAGNPPPAVHAFLKSIPKGKAVSIKMVSASGHSNCKDKLQTVIQTRGGTLDGFEDIKA